jgi:lipopolysaccharide export LptBFGC system permease protein LptF
MRSLLFPLARSTYGVLGLVLLILVGGWVAVDIAELGRHLVNKDLGLASELYGLRLPLLLHRIMPLALVLGLAVTLGQWATEKHLQTIEALGANPLTIPLIGVLLLAPVVGAWWQIGNDQIPTLNRQVNRLLYQNYGIGGAHYWNLHRPTGLVRNGSWLVRFRPQGPTQIRDLEGVKLSGGRVLERLSAAEVNLRESGWIAKNLARSLPVDDGVRTEHQTDATLPFLSSSEAIDHAIGFADEFRSKYLVTMAARAALAGSDPRPFRFEHWRRTSAAVLLLLTLLCAALVAARIAPNSSFNVVLTRATMMGAIYEVSSFLAAGLALVVAPGHEAWAAWLPVALVGLFTVFSAARLRRLR